MIRNKELHTTLLLHKSLQNIVGIWPHKERSILMDFRWILALLLEISPSSINFMEIYFHCHGVKEAFSFLAPTSGACLAVARLIIPRIHRKQLAEIVSSMIEDYSMQQEEQVWNVMKEYAQLSKRVTILIIILVSMIVGVYMSFAISAVTSNRIHLESNTSAMETNIEEVKAFCVFQGASMKKMFTILRALQMSVTGTLTIGTTSFLFELVMYLCGQFDVLGLTLANVEELGAQKKIAKLVERHCHLIKLTNFLEDSFNMSILLYLFVTALIMCIEGFLLILSIKVGDAGKIFHHSSIVLLMLIQLSFYTFAGDCLELRSVTLSHAIYNYNWYDLSPSMGKSYHILLLRASVPHYLTAGKFISMNMITFKDILKSTASYLSVLRVILDE